MSQIIFKQSIKHPKTFDEFKMIVDSNTNDELKNIIINITSFEISLMEKGKMLNYANKSPKTVYFEA